MTGAVEILSVPPCRLGESPYWDADSQSLFWADIKGQTLHRLNLETGAHIVCKVQSQPGFVIPQAGDVVIAGLADGVYRINISTGEAWLVLPVLLPADTRFNDAKIDARGRLWAGIMSEENPPLKKGKLSIMLQPPATVELDLKISNGFAWSPDGHWFYLTDTGDSCIYRYACDPESGNLSDKSVWSRGGLGQPDGLCIDEKGYVYSARYGGGSVLVMDAEGCPVEKIELPVKSVTSCCFGGRNLKTLFITTALSEEPESGCVFAVIRNTAGLPVPTARQVYV